VEQPQTDGREGIIGIKGINANQRKEEFLSMLLPSIGIENGDNQRPKCLKNKLPLFLGGK
jgi:hypothetical protein